MDAPNTGAAHNTGAAEMDLARDARLVPPRPPPPQQDLPLPAYLRAMRRNALTMWPARAYQDPILVRRLLTRTNVLVNDPDAIHRVLVDNHANYRRSPASVRILWPIAGDGLLLSEGEAWRHQRRTIAPALAPRVMPMLIPHIVATAQAQLDRLEAQADAPIDLLAVMQGLALAVAGRSMFSLDTQRFGAVMRPMLAHYSQDLAPPHLLDMLLPLAVPTLRDLRRRRFRARWLPLIEQIMRPRLAEPPPDAPRDLFDLLRAARDPETGEAFTRSQLRDQLATLILAGHETTATTLFWAASLLAQDAGEQARIAAEASAAAITPDSAAAALPGLVRTRAVIGETLRLYPPAFTLVRESRGPDRLGRFDLPRASVVMIAPWVLHRHHRLWRDPDAFDPARFLPDAPPVPRFAYLPFGAGPRVCVGAQFALTEATLVLAMLLQRFTVALDGPPPMPSAMVITQPDRPNPFRLHRR